MPVLHDLICKSPSCSGRLNNSYIRTDTARQRLPRCPVCGGATEIDWMITTRARTAAVHPKERAVVWYNPKTGKTSYPGRNDVPMPSRYANNGYERREFTDLKSLDTFCAQNKLVNEKASFDDGSGRADNL